MNGLEQVQALLAAGKQPPMNETLAFALVEVARGHAVFEGVPDGRAYNLLGTIHGGYAATLLDSACGIATHSALEEGQSYTTLELKVSYHRAMTENTGLVRATGTVISIGRRVAFAEAKLTDANGRLLASATSTLLVISQ
jgi:uncharacterized protein (TIGR00369 family)